jgi:hypothetical protein
VCWKIGSAINVPRRVQQLQTGNPQVLQVRHTLPGDAVLEAKIRQYLRKKKTRNRGRRGCEWFFLDAAQVRELIRKIQQEGDAFPL